MERILGVALKTKQGQIIALAAPNRHHDVIRHMGAAGYGRAIIGPSEQGFYTDKRAFIGSAVQSGHAVLGRCLVASGPKTPNARHPGIARAAGGTVIIAKERCGRLRGLYDAGTLHLVRAGPYFCAPVAATVGSTGNSLSYSAQKSPRNTA